MSFLEELLPKFRKGAKIRRECWKEGRYIDIKTVRMSCLSIMADDWEIYEDPNKEEPDWDYIIKNKCLCWFYDDKKGNKHAGLLNKVEEREFSDDSIFRNCLCLWKNCEPVKKDEVVFYEDKEK